MNTQTTTTPAKHTPGPWITDSGKVQKLGQAIGVLKKSHKPGEKGESICIVALAKDAQPHDLANARLIAAAPVMLEAIIYALEHPVTFVDNTVAAMLEAARDSALGHNA